MVDADFVPSLDARNRIRAHLSSKRYSSNERQFALIAPAFESRRSGYELGNMVFLVYMFIVNHFFQLSTLFRLDQKC